MEVDNGLLAMEGGWAEVTGERRLGGDDWCRKGLSLLAVDGGLLLSCSGDWWPEVTARVWGERRWRRNVRLIMVYLKSI